MSVLQAIIIAIIEGLTEFLPISSTAHMRLYSYFANLNENPFTDLFEVVIQLSAILSIVVIYYKKFFDFKKLDFYIKLIIAVIPSLVAGLLLKKHIDSILDNPLFIAIIMLVGGIVLIFIDKLFTNHTIVEEKEITHRNAFMIGCFQVLSIIFPGLSRSAATIIGGMQQKLTRALAAEFSFFLAVPTMFAASAKQFLDIYQDHPEVITSESMGTLLIGCIVSFIVAFLAVKFFIGVLNKYGFKPFGYYRVVLGIILILVFTLKA